MSAIPTDVAKFISVPYHERESAGPSLEFLVPDNFLWTMKKFWVLRKSPEKLAQGLELGGCAYVQSQLSLTAGEKFFESPILQRDVLISN